MLMGSLRRVPLLRRAPLQRVVDANPLDHQHAVLDHDVPLGVRGQIAFAGFDLARLQRATPGSGQSARRRGDDIVQRRGVRLEAAGGGLVVLGNLIVNAKQDRLPLLR